MMNKSKECLASFLPSVAVLIISIYLKGQIGNIAFYFLICLIYLLLSVLLSILFRKREEELDHPILPYIMPLCMAGWLVANWITDKHDQRYSDTWLRTEVPLWMFFGIVVIFMLVVNGSFQTSGYRKINRIIFTILYAAITGSLLYVPIPFLDQAGGAYHIHAYTSSIFSAVWFRPFDGANRSIYGFYSLFYVLPVRIIHHVFGVDLYRATFMVIVSVGVITLLAAAYVLHCLTRRDSVFYLGLLATGTISYEIYRKGVYLQTFPHRMVFPMLTLALLAYLCRHKERVAKKRILWTPWAMSALAMVWNLETGAVCLMVVAVFSFQVEVLESVEGGFLQRVCKQWKKVLECAGKGILSVLCAYLLVGIWNCFTGGRFLTVKRFLYPIGDSGYNVSNLALPLGSLTYSWFGIVVALLFVTAVCVNRMLRCQRMDARDTIMFSAALMGLGMNTYYMNRAATGNSAMACLTLTMVLTVALDRCIEHSSNITFKEDPFHKGILVVVLFQLCVWAMNPLISYKETVQWKLISAWNEAKLDQLHDLSADIEKNVPDGTPGIGMCVPEIYAMLNRDPRIHVLDFADILSCPEAAQAAITQTLESEYILTTVEGLEWLGLAEYFEVVREFRYDDCVYYYCHRI